jgi:hypothetical protein
MKDGTVSAVLLCPVLMRPQYIGTDSMHGFYW